MNALPLARAYDVSLHDHVLVVQQDFAARIVEVRVVIIVERAYGQGIQGVFQNAFEKNEGEVLESFVTRKRDKTAALKFLRKAMRKHGQPEVIVTDRGRPVARLSPVDAVTEPDGRMAQLEREGRIRMPERSLPPEFLDAPRSEDPEGESLEALLDERREGR